MIIINLSGGLGNQLFQYAFGRTIADKFGLELKLDGNYYFSNACKESDVPRPYLLDRFNIRASLASVREVRKINPVWKKAIRKIKYKLNGSSNAFEYNEKEFNNKDNRYYVGFWQNEKYFKDISGDIRKDLTLKEKMGGASACFFNRIAGDSASVSIHIRRTDILDPKNLYGGICDIGYYERAIELVGEKVKNPSFFVFSDDIEWVRSNLSVAFPCIYVDHNRGADSYIDMQLMSLCRHNIIANSSFSWWGAWLNLNEEKLVVAPRKWFRNNYNDSDLIPTDWVRL